MALLTDQQKAKYRLRHKKSYIASCDVCGRLIDGLYVVNSWTRRKDGLTFLGSLPTDISCMECNGVKTGAIKMVDDLPVTKVKSATEDNQDSLRKQLMRWFRKYEEGFTDEEIIARISKKRDIDRKLKRKGLIRKTLREMKQVDDIKRSKGKWILKPKKKGK